MSLETDRLMGTGVSQTEAYARCLVFASRSLNESRL